MTGPGGGGDGAGSAGAAGATGYAFPEETRARCGAAIPADLGRSPGTAGAALGLRDARHLPAVDCLRVARRGTEPHTAAVREVSFKTGESPLSPAAPPPAGGKRRRGGLSAHRRANPAPAKQPAPTSTRQKYRTDAERCVSLRRPGPGLAAGGTSGRGERGGGACGGRKEGRRRDPGAGGAQRARGLRRPEWTWSLSRCLSPSRFLLLPWWS